MRVGKEFSRLCILGFGWCRFANVDNCRQLALATSYTGGFKVLKYILHSVRIRKVSSLFSSNENAVSESVSLSYGEIYRFDVAQGEYPVYASGAHGNQARD